MTRRTPDPKSVFQTTAVVMLSITTKAAEYHVWCMPFRTIADYVVRHGMASFSDTVYNIVRRFGESSDVSATTTVTVIRNVRIVHIGKTTIHLNSLDIWGWTPHNLQTRHMPYAIRDRG